MSDTDHHAVVGAALMVLIDCITPFMEDVAAKTLPPNVSWTELLRRSDASAGRQMHSYRPTDLSLILRAMTERLGQYGFPFNRHMSPSGPNYARELVQVREQWARNEPFTGAEAYRAIDSVELLLGAAGAPGVPAEIARLKSAIVQEQPGSGTFRAESTDAAGIPPVRFAPSPDSPAPLLPDAAKASSPSIEIRAVGELSYPMAHCRIPIVDHVTIDGIAEGMRGAVLEIDIVSAAGSHGGPYERHVDIAASVTTILRDISLALDPASMLAVDDQRPGIIRATLRDAAGTVKAEATKDVDILASDQWKASPLQLGLEMLAAHVQPNASAIATLMLDVSDRLATATGRSTIDGYQSENPERVDAIAKAVYDAIRARDIRYAEPPASWGLDGQKIRTPAQVLEGRLGTCLDTVVTMAAVLEQAGVNTTLWVLKGHALLGYWRDNSALPTVSTTEVVEVVNLVDLGQLRLVETTMLTGGDKSALFADAVNAPRASHLSGDLLNILGVTDIRQARISRIYPLPSRAISPDGNVVVTEYTPAATPTVAPYQRSGPPGGKQFENESIPPRVANWKNALLDLSLRNRLINYTERAGYRLEVPGPVLGRFEDAVNDDVRITLLASDAVRGIDVARGIRYGRDLPERDRELLLVDKRSVYVDVTEATYKTRLRSLAYKAKTILEETGSNNLYLTFGMLNWRLDDRELQSPLVLVPVTISTTNRGEQYALCMDPSGMSTPNYCLIEKLRVTFGLEIAELNNPALDHSGIDLDGTLDAVRRAIARAGLHFRVEDTAHLGILQFAKFPLWKDLDESWKSLSTNSLVSHLINSPYNSFTDPVTAANEEDLDKLGDEVPVSADSSQLQAIAEAAAGRTFVLEGPPGTGKSQTITNLLAHAMAAGRRVLFVAEKRAALDVVKKRLESVGLGDLSLDLHDKSSRPAAVREQIRAALDLHVAADTDLLRTQSETAESSRNALARYARRLHEENAAHMSLYSARVAELAGDQEILPIDVPRSLVAGGNSTAFETVRQILHKLPQVVDLAQPRVDHPWGFIDAPPSGDLTAAKMHRCAVQFDDALADAVANGLSIESLARCDQPDSFETWQRLCSAPRHPLAALDALREGAWNAELVSLSAQLVWFAENPPGWLATVSLDAVDADIPSIHQASVAADESGFFGRKKRRRAVLEQLSSVLVVDSKSVDLKMLTELTTSMMETHAAVADLRSRVARIPAQVIDGPWNPLDPKRSTTVRKSLAELRWTIATLSAQPGSEHINDLRSYYANQPIGSCAAQLGRIAPTRSHLTTATGIESKRQEQWAQPEKFLTRWWATRAARSLSDSASIEYWIELLRLIEPLRVTGMGTLRTAILNGEIDSDDAALAFQRGLAVASVAERQDTTALRSFNAAAHSKMIERYTKSVNTIRAELPRAIPAQLLQKRRFDAHASSGQIGKLRRQLERKRGGLTVRGLIDHFGDVITQIMPCTLMSPDSVARFFPPQADLFDIVIFDEASQIRVADAIGAMGRSRSVVVVGDSKQMPPTSFAEVSTNIDDDADGDQESFLDEESILTECVHAQVPQQWLSWHYRSQDEALIAFSNQHYYNRRLASFPAPHSNDAPAAGGRGISLIRVDGHFERGGKGRTLRTNRVEAEAIVNSIMSRFQNSPRAMPSLGVITFNAQQRDLIENLLRDSGNDQLVRALDEPDGLFVKNLENVQGDERDAILFSVAFSANDKGVVPLNFGPLSRPGGERRLNVAITRARREVVLYASFDPEQLRAEETSQIGTKHLRAYLEMASRGADTGADSGWRMPVFDRHRDEIAETLRSAGLVVSTDHGLSDFRVDLVLADPSEPGRELVAVLLDGQHWNARGTVADRDALPITVLKDLMRWPAVERVWLPEWLNRREQVVAHLKEAVEQAGRPVDISQHESEAVAPVVRASPLFQPPPPSRVIQVNKPAAPQKHPMIQMYRDWAPGLLGDVGVLDDLSNYYAKGRVRDAAVNAIEVEAPIHPQRLAKIVAAAFGLTRVNENRVRSIQQAVPAGFKRRTGEGFYWPEGVEPEDWRIVRQPQPGTSRQLDQVSLIEIGNAMIVVAEQAGGIDDAEIKREALNLLGSRRVTKLVSAQLDAALIAALKRGVLRRNGSGVIIVE